MSPFNSSEQPELYANRTGLSCRTATELQPQDSPQDSFCERKRGSQNICPMQLRYIYPYNWGVYGVNVHKYAMHWEYGCIWDSFFRVTPKLEKVVVESALFWEMKKCFSNEGVQTGSQVGMLFFKGYAPVNVGVISQSLANPVTRTNWRMLAKQYETRVKCDVGPCKTNTSLHKLNWH